MADRNRLGFTLVELLVVIVIISVLIGLLLPAVVGSRESARQVECVNNQRQLGQAIKQYEGAKDRLPGYINSFSGSSNLSWAVVILQYLDRDDLWTEWRRPDGTRSYNNKRTNFMPSVPQFKCPSNTQALSQGALCYVVNCGIQDGTGTEVPPGSGTMRPESGAHGVFFNHFDASKPIAVSTDRLSDGAQHTLLLSENIQATQWAPPLDSSSGTWTGFGPPEEREAHVGMVWWPAPPATPPGCEPVNRCRERESDPLAPDIELGRPSSNHPDGVVVTYCDSHQDTVFDDIDYNVFRQLMAPDDNMAGIVP